jgi:hypothetical protein
MKSPKWWIVLYVLAAIIVLGRIGNAVVYPDHFWRELLRIEPLGSATSVGEWIGWIGEGLLEDFVVFVVIRRLVRKIMNPSPSPTTIPTIEEPMCDIPVPLPAVQPYRWGKFQGWALISIGLVQLALTILLHFKPDYRPQNDTAVGYFNSFARHHAGENTVFLAACWVITIVFGVLILRRRMLLFLLLALYLIVVAVEVNWPQLVLWTACTFYYVKRRKEFNWP